MNLLGIGHRLGKCHQTGLFLDQCRHPQHQAHKSSRTVEFTHEQGKGAVGRQISAGQAWREQPEQPLCQLFIDAIASSGSMFLS